MRHRSHNETSLSQRESRVVVARKRAADTVRDQHKWEPISRQGPLQSDRLLKETQWLQRGRRGAWVPNAHLEWFAIRVWYRDLLVAYVDGGCRRRRGWLFRPDSRCSHRGNDHDDCEEECKLHSTSPCWTY